MTRETRFIWVMVIIIGIIIALALYGYFTGAWQPAPETFLGRLNLVA